MCLQCCTKAVRYGDSKFLGEFAMYRATRDSSQSEPIEWQKDKIGLVIMNDPSFIFNTEPVKDPYAGLSDDEIDALPPEARHLHRKFIDVGYSFEEDLMSGRSSMDIYRLIKAARETKEKHYTDEDSHFPLWLCDRMARWIETAPVVNEYDADVG